MIYFNPYVKRSTKASLKELRTSPVSMQ